MVERLIACVVTYQGGGQEEGSGGGGGGGGRKKREKEEAEAEAAKKNASTATAAHLRKRHTPTKVPAYPSVNFETVRICPVFAGPRSP